MRSRCPAPLDSGAGQGGQLAGGAPAATPPMSSAPGRELLGKKWASWAQEDRTELGRGHKAASLGGQNKEWPRPATFSLTLSNLNYPGRQMLCLFFREVFLCCFSEADSYYVAPAGMELTIM